MAPIRKKRTSIRARSSTAARTKVATPATLPLPEDLENSLPAQDDLGNNNGNNRGFEEAWKLSKKDKRTVKRGLLLQKVRDAGISKEQQHGKQKRRRPAKKLRTDIGELADALPDVDHDDGEEEWSWEGLSDDDEDYRTGAAMQLDGGASQKRTRRKRQKLKPSSTSQRQQGKIVMTSLRHRPGAMKRKRKMEGSEMERFGRNLAQLSGAHAAAGSGESARNGTWTGRDGGTGAVGSANVSHGEKWAALRNFIGGTMEKEEAFAKS